MRNHTTIAWLISLGLLTACNATSTTGDAEADATAETSSSIQSALDSARAKAAAGENPTKDCNAIKAHALTEESATASTAVAECSYDIPVRYFNVLLDEVDAGTLTCVKFMTSMSTQLRLMTMSFGGLKRAIDARGNGEADAAATAAVVGATTGDATEQARQRIKAELAPRALAACPIMTMYFKH